MMYRIVLLFTAALVFVQCENTAPKHNPDEPVHVTGKTQGTTYSILYYDSLGRDFKTDIDELLAQFDSSISTYNPSAEMYRLNASDTVRFLKDPYNFIYHSFNEAKHLAMITEGMFDFTIYPVANYYGFYTGDKPRESQEEFEEALSLVDFNGINVHSANGLVEINRRPGQQMDFNAIAQGYSVDLLANLLTERGINSFMVEVGGEVYAKGRKHTGESWRIGIDKPVEKEEDRALQTVVHLDGYALATSGSYRKFYEKDGKRYSHAISPITGLPVQHNLLSVSVLAERCEIADGFATAFLIMGTEATLDFLHQHPEYGLEVFLIFDQGNGELETLASDGFESILSSGEDIER